MTEIRLEPSELELLRRLQLKAEEAALAAQRAQLELKQAMLEIEVKYELLATDAQLNIITGRIIQEKET